VFNNFGQFLYFASRKTCLMKSDENFKLLTFLGVSPYLNICILFHFSKQIWIIFYNIAFFWKKRKICRKTYSFTYKNIRFERFSVYKNIIGRVKTWDLSYFDTFHTWLKVWEENIIKIKILFFLYKYLLVIMLF